VKIFEIWKWLDYKVNIEFKLYKKENLLWRKP